MSYCCVVIHEHDGSYHIVGVFSDEDWADRIVTERNDDPEIPGLFVKHVVKIDRIQ